MMSESKKQERQEAALLDVVRLGLSGDQRSLRQRARNLLRTGQNPLLSEDGRRYLQDLLLAGDDVSPLRSKSRSKQVPASVPLPGEAMPIADSVEEARPPVLESEAEDKISRLIREYEHRHMLEEANLGPTTRVLLCGPPGGGKTMTARYIAHSLGVPLMLAEPSQVLTGVMGQSARNLSALMRNAAAAPCVLFLDELDAYARRRNETHDIAEPKRLVNTLLLELDRWPAHGLIIAATNHSDILDKAVRRRFEMTVELGYPGPSARREIVNGVLIGAGRKCPPELLEAVALVTKGYPGSELVNDTVAAIRRSIIDGLSIEVSVGQQFLAGRFVGRGRKESAARRMAASHLAAAGWSLSEIAPIINVQPQSVAKILETRE